MAEDFTEEQFDDELPADAEPADEPAVVPKSPKSIPRSPIKEEPVEVPKERYGAFMIPTRIGVIDNETGQPLAEDTEINGLLLGLVTKLLNDVDEIKKSL